MAKTDAIQKQANGSSVGEASLYACLRIDVGDRCPIARQRTHGEILSVDTHFWQNVCHMSVVSDQDGDIQVTEHEKPMTGACVGQVFSDHGVVPRIVDVGEGALHVSAFFEDRDSLRRIVSDLSEMGISAALEFLKELSGEDEADSESVYLYTPNRLTGKELEAVEVGIEMGYYDPTSACNLSAIADELGIGKSAASKRLRSAESKVMTELFRMQQGGSGLGKVTAGAPSEE